MTNAPYEWTLIQDATALQSVLKRAGMAETIGVDVEANGLFVYRQRLCTVQLAWEEDERTHVAVIDTLRVDAQALAPLFTAPRPIKVLHDLTFDARMLHDNGAALRNVRDTSVAARLLGQQATGLAAVLATELGVVLDKHLQQYDWSRRPLEASHLQYLSNDVAYLMRLDRALMVKATAADIIAEIEAECAYKLTTALAPPRDQRPGYVRIKGVQHLDATARAVLMHLVATRETIAEQHDVPSFKVITNEVLMELAKKRPTTMADLSRIRGAVSGRAGRYAHRWLEAIARGIADGDIPETDRALFEPPPFDRQAVARRRALESKITTFRKREAKRRGVDEQVVLPGHCVADVVTILLSSSPTDPTLVTRIANIPGLGSKRAEKYAELLARLPHAHGAAKDESGE